MNTRVKLSELVDAYEWAGATGPYENAAYVCRASGRIWQVSDFDDAGEEPPDDIGDDSLYLGVPNKNELDLGRRLALRWCAQRLPEHYERVRGFFAARGAYAQFKNLLDEVDLLDDWHAFEARGVEDALRAWAADNAIELVEGSDDKGG